MKRSEFLKSVLAGVAVAAIPASFVLEPATTQVVYASQFKITKELWRQIADDDGKYSVADLDKLCMQMCGAPFKEVGYLGDDFAKDLLTVRAFSRDPNSNDFAEDNGDRPISTFHDLLVL